MLLSYPIHSQKALRGVGLWGFVQSMLRSCVQAISALSWPFYSIQNNCTCNDSGVGPGSPPATPMGCPWPLQSYGWAFGFRFDFPVHFCLFLSQLGGGNCKGMAVFLGSLLANLHPSPALACPQLQPLNLKTGPNWPKYPPFTARPLAAKTAQNGPKCFQKGQKSGF